MTIKQGVGWTHLTQHSNPNFCDSEGRIYMKKCPKCQRENYALAVAFGQCAWCNFDLNKFINPGEAIEAGKTN